MAKIVTINSLAKIAIEVTRSICEITGLRDWISTLNSEDCVLKNFVGQCIELKSYFRLVCVRNFDIDSWDITVFPFIDELVKVNFKDLPINTQLKINILTESSFRVQEKTPEGGRMLFKCFDYNNQINEEIQKGLILSSLLILWREKKKRALLTEEEEEEEKEKEKRKKKPPRFTFQRKNFQNCNHFESDKDEQRQRHNRDDRSYR